MVAHVADGADPKIARMLVTAVKYGFRMNVMNQREAQNAGAKPTEELCKELRATVGVKLKATDVDWEHGEGSEVSGPAESLLMAMAGRPVALAELSGPGLDTLKQRIGS